MENTSGKVFFSNDVLATIAGIAAGRVEGVSGLNGGLKDDISGLLGKNSLKKGIKVSVNDDIADIDISINVEYGTDAYAVCKKIMEAVRNDIMSMTGLNVGAVNVSVEGISFKSEDKKNEKQKTKEQET